MTMVRPLPTWPRGKRKRRRVAGALLLGCPRISPEFELSTVLALMKPKPQTREAVAHRDGAQAWSDEAQARVEAVLVRLREQGVGVRWHGDAAGEFHLLAKVPGERLDEAKAVAVALSSAVPENWFVLGRWFLRGGRFYRRRFGYQLELRRATDVHLTKPLRALVQQVTADLR